VTFNPSAPALSIEIWRACGGHLAPKDANHVPGAPDPAERLIHSMVGRLPWRQ
jgi:hypothetical protein